MFGHRLIKNLQIVQNFNYLSLMIFENLRFGLRLSLIDLLKIDFLDLIFHCN